MVTVNKSIFQSPIFSKEGVDYTTLIKGDHKVPLSNRRQMTECRDHKMDQSKFLHGVKSPISYFMVCVTL